MLEIRKDGEALDLTNDFSIEIAETNPIFNDVGSQSIPATVPTTNRNVRLLNAPTRVDSSDVPKVADAVVDVVQGAYMRRGKLNITEASSEAGITFNIGFDNATAYERWQQKKLSELSGLPVWRPSENLQGTDLEKTLDYLNGIYANSAWGDDISVFPVAVNFEEAEVDGSKKIYWEILNTLGDHGLLQPDEVNRYIDGAETKVTIPEGYGITPFLRVWRVLELIFADLGVRVPQYDTLEEDKAHHPFRYNAELNRLVVLNNAADAICRGNIDYADLMPDCTVLEFLNALWVRFGLVYNVNFDTSTVDFRLLRDIITHNNGGEDLTRFYAGNERIIYNTPQYIKLKAATSIDGAAPVQDRFEDFVRGLDVSKVRFGSHVTQWIKSGSDIRPKWEGDMSEDYYDNPWEDDPFSPDDEWDPNDRDWDRDDDPDYDDSDDGRDDDRDDDRDDRSRARSRANTDEEEVPTSLAHEYVTGKWHRLDNINGKVQESSTPFFDWDPQPEGYEVLDLTSADEFVPVEWVTNYGTGSGNNHADYTPCFLVGARHYHTYIKGCDTDNGAEDGTPLAFMFAYNVRRNDKTITIGRFSPEGDDGKPIELVDGSKPTLSLLFQFKDGLFANFWREYDELLRHGNRSVEISTRVNKVRLHSLNLLQTYQFKNVRCLIDTMNYVLPAPKLLPVEMKLRLIQPQGTYDIESEQVVPDFSHSRHLAWCLHSESFSAELLDTPAAKSAAVVDYYDNHDYIDHGVDGDRYYISPDAVVLRGISRFGLIWEKDTSLPTVQVCSERTQRTYQARLDYDIYEVHEVGTGDNIVRTISEKPIGVGSALIPYSVRLIVRWVPD